MLAVVDRAGRKIAPATAVAGTLQQALDDWERLAPELEQLADELNRGAIAGAELRPETLMAPLPRAYEWVDGSAYINHIALVRRARGAALPEGLETDPLVYQGGSGIMLGAREPIELANADWGLDYEAEVCVVLGDTPRGLSASAALPYVRLLMLANDVTYRNLVPEELKKGFGFFVSKPATAFSPFAVTPDELGSAWREGRVHLPLCSWVNGVAMGDPDAGPEMHFSFYDLIAHITKTRAFTAGTILGSGTVSNNDPSRGVSCLAERRTRELLDNGAARTEFLLAGDRVEIEMLGADGQTVFGRIEQQVIAV
jgi:fumarylacetoacetate (FAA) hydrolase